MAGHYFSPLGSSCSGTSSKSQFSVFTRLGGYTKYGGRFNYLGFGNFFGQIGEIRISNVRRYGR